MGKVEKRNKTSFSDSRILETEDIDLLRDSYKELLGAYKEEVGKRVRAEMLMEVEEE